VALPKLARATEISIGRRSLATTGSTSRSRRS
jgi:hypothetical protein